MANNVNITIGAKNATDAAFKSASTNVSKLGISVRSVTAGLKMVSVAALAAGGTIAASLTAAVVSFTKAGSDLADMSARLGVSAQGLSELGYAAGMTGASMEDVEKSIKTMLKTLHAAKEGSAASVEALSSIGVTLDDLAGKSPEDQFTLLAGAIGSIQDAGERSALAMKVFGKSGSALIPMMSQGVDGLKAMRQQAIDLGVAMSDDAAGKADALGDSFDRLKAVMTGFKNKIAAAIAPILTQIIDNFVKFGSWLSSNYPQIWELVVETTKLQLVQFAEVVRHAVTVQVPAYVMWFSEAVITTFQDMWRYVTQITQLAVSNLIVVWQAMFQFMENKSALNASLVVTQMAATGAKMAGALAEGFQSNVKPLPEVADRVVGPLETSLKSKIMGITAGLTTSFADAIGMTFTNATEDLDVEVGNNMGVKLKEIGKLTANESRLLGRGGGNAPMDKVAENTKQALAKQDRIIQSLDAIHADNTKKKAGLELQVIA